MCLCVKKKKWFTHCKSSKMMDYVCHISFGVWIDPFFNVSGCFQLSSLLSESLFWNPVIWHDVFRIRNVLILPVFLPSPKAEGDRLPEAREEWASWSLWGGPVGQRGLEHALAPHAAGRPGAHRAPGGERRPRPDPARQRRLPPHQPQPAGGEAAGVRGQVGKRSTR